MTLQATTTLRSRAGQTTRILAHVVPAAIALVLLAVALWVLSQNLADLSGQGLARALVALSPAAIAGAVALALCSYALLALNEATALRFSSKPLPFMRGALVSFISYAFAHNIGFNVLTSGSIRYRMYARDGLGAREVAAVTAYNSVTFIVASLTLAGIALMAEPQSVLNRLGISAAVVHPLGLLILLSVAGYFALSLGPRQLTTFGSWSITVPQPKFAAAQIAVGTLDMLASAGITYALLPDVGINFPAFAGIYTLATWAGLISYLPGGAGVFEAAMVLMLPRVPKEQLVAALIGYRAIYYVLPLLAAATLAAADQLLPHRAAIDRFAAAIERRTAPILAPVIGLLVFLGGIVLLLSGATPELAARMTILKPILPLPLIELSHLVGSVSGLALLILARGLFRRLDGAYVLSMVVLAVGIAVSLLKGLDFEEAIVLSIIMLLLHLSRSAFYRRSNLLAEPFTVGWIASIAAALGGTVWLGLFVYRSVEYANDLWFNFAIEGDAQRFLRATALIAVGVVGFALLRLLRLKSADETSATTQDIERARPIALTSGDTLAQLVMTGDKSILFSPSGRSFLMYATQGRSWIALSGPFGDPAEARDLAWRFREICDAHEARPVFYQVALETLPLCLDLGLSIVKLGEEAHVPLESFTLDGRKGRDLRLARNRALRDGLTFEVLPRESIGQHLDQLKAVSDCWLEKQKVAEKGFALGQFDPAYLVQMRCAVVRRGDRIVAFANILESAGKEELSVDLMRYAVDGRQGVMDFLFAELMLWGAANDFERFNLGMAPLSGLEDRRLAPLWHRAGSMVFRHGEAFYNFEGLRQFKEKFCPEWRARFLACQSGLSLPYVLIDVGTLISGGLKEMIAK